jgi:ATP-dependent Lhr-like helicase
VLRYREGGGMSLERQYKGLFGKVRLDEAGHLVLSSPAVARSLYQNIGTITSEVMVLVRTSRRRIGQSEESFMRRMNPGDVFVLNGRCFRLVKTHLLTATVKAANGSLPTIPRWYANKMPLASGLAAEVGRLRARMAAGLDPGWLQSEYGITRGNADALVAHFALQAEISAIPTPDSFLVEVYREPGIINYFFHSLIGRSANDALSRVVARRVKETKGGNALTTIDDYGFLLTLRDFQELGTGDWKALFRREGAEDAMREALADSSLVKWQFRGTSQTGLMVPRRVHGAERGPRAMQFSSEIIFNVLRRYEPDHPLLVEAYSEVTLRFLDLPRALDFMDRVAALPWDVRELDRISPFSFGIFVSKIKETMTLEDPETTIERLYHDMYGHAETALHGNPR